MPAAETTLEISQVCKLLQLVYKKDKAQIEKLVSNGIPHLVNYNEPKWGRTALIVASISNNEDMLEFLLSLGAHPDVVDFKGRSAAMRAAEYGHIQCLEKLIAGGASMKIQDIDAKGILFYLLTPTERHTYSFNLAIDNGAEVNIVANDGTTALLTACEDAIVNEDICLNFLKNGADPNLRNEKNNRTTIMAASSSGSVKVVKTLLQNGGNPNIIDWRKNSAAHFAATGGYFEVLATLAGYNANFELINNEGKNPLYLAVRGCHPLCCRFLAQRGSNPKIKASDGYTPRLLAKDMGHKPTLKEVKKAEKIYPKIGKSIERWSILFYDWLCVNEERIAAEAEKIEQSGPGIMPVSDFRCILQNLEVPISEHNLDMVLKTHTKNNNLDMKEIMSGKKFLQKAFLMVAFLGKPKKPKKEKGGKGKKGKFKLPMPICTNGDLKRTEGGNPPVEFIQYTACVTDTNRFGRDQPPNHPLQDDSAWYMKQMGANFININDAVRCNDKISLVTAIENGTPVDTKDKYYKTPLMIACALGSIELVKLLLEKKANVNITDNFKWSALHHACHGGQLNVVKLLVENGSDINAPALNGGTPLTRAIEASAFDVVQFLLESGAKVQTETRKGLSPMDIARSYADPRVINIIDSKWIPPDEKKKKEKDKKKKKKDVPPAMEMEAVKSASDIFEDVDMRMEKKQHIEHMATAIMENFVEPEDITYTPRRAWIQMPMTDQLIREMEQKREQFGWEVDFPDFRMRFDDNIANKIIQIYKEEGLK